MYMYIYINKYIYIGIYLHKGTCIRHTFMHVYSKWYRRRVLWGVRLSATRLSQRRKNTRCSFWITTGWRGWKSTNKKGVYKYIYTYMRIYIYIRIYVYIHLSIYLFIYLSIYMSIYSSIYLYIYAYMYICIYIYVYTYICIYVDRKICTYRNVYMYVHTSTCKRKGRFLIRPCRRRGCSRDGRTFEALSGLEVPDTWIQFFRF